MNEPIDITPGGPIPPADTAAARRRLWIGLLAAGALASMVAGGAGYAALNQPAERRATVLPAVSVPVLPYGGDLLPTAEAVPSAAPVRKSTAPAAEPTRTPPTTTAAPTITQAPPPTRTTQPPRSEDEPQPLTASYSGGGEWRPDGLHQYGGSVSLDGPGDTTTGWRLRLTVPGGNPVHAGGDVRVRQDGQRVVFTPGPDGADYFEFWIDGVLPAEPYGCLVDGHACG